MQDFSNDKDIVKVIRKRKSKRTLIRCGMTLPLVIYFFLLGNSLVGGIPIATVFALTAGFFSIFNFSNNSREESREKTREILEELSKDIAKFVENPNWRIFRLDDITIIPKNIKVGENLDSLNIVPIFKKGKFIIIQGSHSLEILAQYDEDDKTVVKILDKDEVTEEYSQFDEKTKRKMYRKSKLLSYIIND